MKNLYAPAICLALFVASPPMLQAQTTPPSAPSATPRPKTPPPKPRPPKHIQPRDVPTPPPPPSATEPAPARQSVPEGPLAPDAHGEGPRHLADGYSLGLGLGLAEQASQVKLELKFPTLFKVPEGQFFSSDYSIFAEISSMTFRNVTVPDKSRYENRSAALFAAGLNMRHAAANPAFATYGRVGLVFANPSKDVAADNSWGGMLAGGVEFMTSHAVGPMPMSAALATFLEFDYRLGFKRADKLAGEPDLFNGLSLLFGVRAYSW